MATGVVVPEVGEVGMDLTFVGWLKPEGASVRAGEALFEVDTEKSTVEIEALADGTLVGLAARTGDIVKPRQVIARILAAGELDTASPGPAEPEAGLSSPAPAPAGPVNSPETPGAPQATAPAMEPPSMAARSGTSASPKARRLAASEGLDLAGVPGTGPDGLITERDVEAALAARAVAPAAEGGAAAMSIGADRAARTRRAVAERTLAAWREIPHFYLSLEAEVSRALVLARPTVALVHALARALAAHPECNVEWDGSEVRPRDTVDVGVLVDTPRGLLLPAIRGADRLDLAALADAIDAAVARARSGTLGAEDLPARSATVSNLGMHAVDRFAAVITSPDPLTLAVGRARTVPRWDGAAWRPATVVDLTLSVDHRALDGATAARLLTTLESILANLEASPA